MRPIRGPDLGTTLWHAAAAASRGTDKPSHRQLAVEAGRTPSAASWSKTSSESPRRGTWPSPSIDRAAIDEAAAEGSDLHELGI